jgi:AraC-like DNA-binding protein
LIPILYGNQEIVNYNGDFKIRIYPNREYEDYPQHWHTDIEIIMPIENNYRIIVNETTYDLKADEIIVIPPGELHQCVAPPTGYRIIIQFDGKLLYNLNGFDSAFHMFRPCVVITSSVLSDLRNELSGLIKDITKEYFSALPFREAAAYSTLIRFFTILSRHVIGGIDRFSDVKKQRQHKYIDLFINVCNYINEHCTENINIDDIANIAGFSKFHFARLFKEIMNVSCYEYLIDRRLMFAKKLLIEPGLTITQVAMKSGFSSIATFNRVFKNKNHCTPTEYKMMYELKREIERKDS